MNFVVTADEVRTVFGLTGVVRFPRYRTPHNSLDTRTAHLLSDVGLPDTEWFMSKASLRTDDSIDIPHWYSTWGAAPTAPSSNPCAGRWKTTPRTPRSAWTPCGLGSPRSIRSRSRMRTHRGTSPSKRSSTASGSRSCRIRDLLPPTRTRRERTDSPPPTRRRAT
ncbi:SUKH-4 family immunity protein [Streptomyces sp. NPDC012950]|uniref:SUKH-4 family immunity protein n=1 Tax=Streptomyces sp. NPDC012950 TaxID=3364858 RepID=UPI0036949E8A